MHISSDYTNQIKPTFIRIKKLTTGFGKFDPTQALFLYIYCVQHTVFFFF